MPTGVYERKPRTRFVSYERRSTPKASCSPTLRDLEWAAGFLEGEGTFNRSSGGTTAKGYVRTTTERADAWQVNQEPITRLQRLFGGSMGLIDFSKCSHNKTRYLWHWGVSGARARGVMQTLYALLSAARRQQVRRALQVGV